MTVALLHKKQVFCDEAEAKVFEDTLSKINEMASSIMALKTLLSQQLESEMDGEKENWFLRDGLLVAIESLSDEISDKASFLDMKIN